jgi:hypothetical protein
MIDCFFKAHFFCLTLWKVRSESVPVSRDHGPGRSRFMPKPQWCFGALKKIAVVERMGGAYLSGGGG